MGKPIVTVRAVSVLTIQATDRKTVIELHGLMRTFLLTRRLGPMLSKWNLSDIMPCISVYDPGKERVIAGDPGFTLTVPARPEDIEVAKQTLAKHCEKLFIDSPKNI